MAFLAMHAKSLSHHVLHYGTSRRDYQTRRPPDVVGVYGASFLALPNLQWSPQPFTPRGSCLAYPFTAPDYVINITASRLIFLL